MKPALLALSLFAALPAYATYCQDNSPIGDHVNDDCHAPFKNPTKNPVAAPTAALSGAAALAGSQAGADAAANATGIKGSVNPSATGVVGGVSPVASGSGTGVKGNVSPTAAAAGGAAEQQQQQQAAAIASGTGAVRVGRGGDVVTNNRTEVNTLVLPTFAPAPALPPMIASNSQAVLSACMPRKELWREPVYVLVRNNFWPDEMKQVGWDEFTRDDKKEPYRIIDVPVAFREDGTIIYQKVPHGHQQLTKKEFQKAASGSSFQVAGIGKSGGGGVGGGDQGVVERWSTSIELFDCPLEMKPAVIIKREEPPAAAAVVRPPRPPKPPRTYRPRNVPPAAIPCCCTVVLPPSCSAPKASVAISR